MWQLAFQPLNLYLALDDANSCLLLESQKPTSLIPAFCGYEGRYLQGKNKYFLSADSKYEVSLVMYKVWKNAFVYFI